MRKVYRQRVVVFRSRRAPRRVSLLTFRGGLGLTLWRDGAVSFIWRGKPRFQLVFGDWWEAQRRLNPGEAWDPLGAERTSQT